MSRKRRVRTRREPETSSGPQPFLMPPGLQRRLGLETESPDNQSAEHETAGQHEGHTPLENTPVMRLIQRKTSKPQIQRAPPEEGYTSLPDPDSGTQDAPVSEPEPSYQWQNRALLDTVYNDPKSEGNDRLLALRSFLQIQKELELDAKVIQLSDNPTPEELAAAMEQDLTEIANEITSLSTQESEAKAAATQAKENLDANKEAIKAAKAELKAYLKGNPDAKEMQTRHAEIRKKIEKLKLKLVADENNIKWLKRTGKYTTDENAVKGDKQIYFDNLKQTHQTQLTEQEALLAADATVYEETLGPYENTLRQLQELEIQYKQTQAEQKARAKAAREEIDARIKLQASIQGAKKGEVKALKNFKLDRYTRQLDGMDHEALLQEILTLFDEDDKRAAADPAYVRRFPDWQRYAVIHLSGMRYQSAHGSWADPTLILKHIRQENFAARSAEQRRIMQAEAAQSVDPADLKAEGVDRKTIATLKNSTPDAIRKKLKKADTPIFLQIQQADAERTQLLLELQQSGDDAAAAEKIRENIALKDGEIEQLKTGLTVKGRKTVQDAMDARAAALQTVAEHRASQDIREMTSEDAIAQLKQMHAAGELPDVIWKEILAFSEGRVFTEDMAWEHRERLQNTKGKTPEEEALIRQWEAILINSKFLETGTRWREQHGKTLSPSITSSLVCDQLGSQIQHLRGLKRGGGLRKNALFYKQQQAKGAPGAYFRHPISVDDFRPGASIYWMHWTDSSLTPEYAKVWKKQEPLIQRRNGVRKTIQGLNEQLTTGKSNGKTLKKWQLEDLPGKIAKQEEKLKQLDTDIQALEDEGKSMRQWAPEKDKQPDISQVVFYDQADADSVSVEGIHFNQNTVDKEGWTYRAVEQDFKSPKAKEIAAKKGEKYKPMMGKVVMRVKPNPWFVKPGEPPPPLDFSREPNEKMLKQWLGWQHEATVMYADTNHTITFDTSGSYQSFGAKQRDEIKGMSTRQRSTQELLKDPFIFVGYDPGVDMSAQVSPWLDFRMGNMEEDARTMTDGK